MVGGVSSYYNLFPFLVQIFVKLYSDQPRHICGGSLITYDWVMTAAHCCEDYQNSRAVIYLGAGRNFKNYTSFRSGKIKFLFGQTRRAEFFAIHEKYREDPKYNDIALIKVKMPFLKTSEVSLVKLPERKIPTDLSETYQYCYIGGWGNMSPNIIHHYNAETKKWEYNREIKIPYRMHHVVLPLISNYECHRLSEPSIGVYFNLKITQICTLYYPGRKSTCRGDSGGPLICNSRQYGICSSSYSCGKPRIGADIFTRVDHYLTWINETLEKYRLAANVSQNMPRIIDENYYDEIINANLSRMTDENYYDELINSNIRGFEISTKLICIVWLLHIIL